MLAIIVPTLGNRIDELKRLFDSLEKQSNSNFEVILSVQGNHDTIRVLVDKYNMPVKICNLYAKGLSYARNKAIKLIDSNATLVTFSDDDCWYPAYAVECALINFNNENCSICYKIHDPIINAPYTIVEKNKLNLRDSLKVSSIEIFISKNIIDSGITFDERFGLGTKYPSGEENIFLFDIIKSQYNIKYFPEVIVYHLKPQWTNKEYIFKGKGALFAKLYNRYIALIFIIIYALKKSEYSSNIKSDFMIMFKEVISYK